MFEHERHLLQQLHFGFQDLLHVADLVLPLCQAPLQLCFILIGQALCRRSALVTALGDSVISLRKQKNESSEVQ